MCHAGITQVCVLFSLLYEVGYVKLVKVPTAGPCVPPFKENVRRNCGLFN